MASRTCAGSLRKASLASPPAHQAGSVKSVRRGEATIDSLRDTFTIQSEAKGRGKGRFGLLIGHGSVETAKKYSHLVSADIFDVAQWPPNK